MMKLAVSSYSFSQAIRAGILTQEETVVKAKEMGFEGIEFTTLMPCENPTLEQQLEMAKRIRKKAEEIGITVTNYAIPAQMYQETEEESAAEVARVKGQVQVAKELGCTTMRHDVCNKLGTKCRSFDLMLPTMVKNIREVADFAQELGIKTCSENHGFISQDSDRMERLFNAVNHPNYGLLADMGNFSCVDENHAVAVSRVAPYTVYVHAKDMILYDGNGQNPGAGCGMSRGGNWYRCTIIGQGSVPVKQCLRILKRAGYDGFVSIEFEGCEECFSGIEKGKANLERYLKEIELDFQ